MTIKEVVVLLVIVMLVGVGVALYPTRHALSEHARVAHGSIDWDRVVDDPNEKLTISWMGVPIAPAVKEGTWIETMLAMLL